MTLSLSKGQNLSLSKKVPGVDKFTIGLGWDARTTTGTDFDLDAFALLVGADGNVRSSADFIYFNQKEDAVGSVIHLGDNLTGAGDGDDEQITIDLSKVPADVEKVVIAVSIFEADERGQTFGQVRNAFVRLVDSATNDEPLRYDLAEDSSTETAVVFAEIYRNNGEWKFKAIGQGYDTGMVGVAKDFGVPL